MVVNDDFYVKGLVDVNCEVIDDGNSMVFVWVQWFFVLMCFEGMMKYVMVSVVCELYYYGCVVLFYVDIGFVGEDLEWFVFVWQMGNMKVVLMKVSYSSFQMVDIKIGDDFFDVKCVVVYVLVMCGLVDVLVVIQSCKVSCD